MKTEDRLKSILERDKETIGEAPHRAALADFCRVAEEYFETDGGFELTVRQGKKGLEAVFACRIVRVKNFITLS